MEITKQQVWENEIAVIAGLTGGLIRQLLNERGAEGWEPFACDGKRMYFKRPKAAQTGVLELCKQAGPADAA